MAPFLGLVCGFLSSRLVFGHDLCPIWVGISQQVRPTGAQPSVFLGRWAQTTDSQTHGLSLVLRSSLVEAG